MKIYLAARYSRRSELEGYAKVITKAGHEVVSRWVYGAEEVVGISKEAIAILDIEDVDKADAVVSFTEPEGSYNQGGGRHVEFGYGLAKGKKMIIIGDRENVFHNYPGIFVYKSLQAWLLAEWPSAPARKK